MFDKIKNLLEQGKDGIETAENLLDTVDHVGYGLKYRTSKSYHYDRSKADKIDRFSHFLGWFFIALWGVILIATIVLCVTGNDAVLRFLSL